MFLKPKESVVEMGIPPGGIVADFGAGIGAYTLPVGRMLGGKGRVFAIDVQQDLLVRLKRTATEEGITNVDVVWGDIEKIGGTALREQSVDFVIVANVLFQTEEKQNVIREAKRVLRPGGRGKLVLIDWSQSFRGMGPHKDQIVGELVAKRLVEDGGFVFEKNISVGAYHYGLLFHT